MLVYTIGSHFMGIFLIMRIKFLVNAFKSYERVPLFTGIRGQSNSQIEYTEIKPIHSEKLEMNRNGNTILSEKICDLFLI